MSVQMSNRQRKRHLSVNPQASTPTNMTTTISFRPDGTALCLWTEALPLHELGRLEITRASTIDFSSGAQQWEVKDQEGRVRLIARSRSACLEWEQQNLQPERPPAFVAVETVIIAAQPIHSSGPRVPRGADCHDSSCGRFWEGTRSRCVSPGPHAHRRRACCSLAHAGGQLP